MNLYIIWTRSGKKAAVRSAYSHTASALLKEQTGEETASWWIGDYGDVDRHVTIRIGLE